MAWRAAPRGRGGAGGGGGAVVREVASTKLNFDIAISYHRSSWGPQTPHTDPIACTNLSPFSRSPDRPQARTTLLLGVGLLIHTSQPHVSRGRLTV